MKSNYLIQAAEDFAKEGRKLLSGSSISKSPKSISSYAAKAIYYFPILCSKTVSGNTAFTLSNNLEAAYSSFIRACFSMIPAVAVSGDSVNVEDYLKMFHQNMGIRSGTEFYLSLKEDAEPYELFPNPILNEASIKENLNNILTKSGNGDFTIKTDTKTVTNKKGKTVEKITARKPFSASEFDAHNKLKPSIVNVNCSFIIKEQQVQVSIPVGVKTVIHPVNTTELCDHIMDSVAGKGLLHNLIRYTTGEIMSLGDILFGISKIKKNVANEKSSDVARWINAIDERKRLNKLSRTALQKKPYLPNISVILSMDDINDMEHLIGYNLFKDTFRAVKFMKDNFLLSFVIADDITETAYILYDGHTSYEEYPYSALKRENERNADAVTALSKSLGLK